MIVRRWGTKVPLHHAAGFHQHLLASGVSEYLKVEGCQSVEACRRRDDTWEHFRLTSHWRDMAFVTAHTGTAAGVAVLYENEEKFGLVAANHATNFELYFLVGGAARRDHLVFGAGGGPK